jgi:hypothetical protein
LTANTKDDQARVEGIFAAFNESWLVYWDAYVELQNQLYESVKAAREVSWLAATDTDEISRINMAQRELFASMPRRMDYSPWRHKEHGQCNEETPNPRRCDGRRENKMPEADRCNRSYQREDCNNKARVTN